MLWVRHTTRGSGARLETRGVGYVAGLLKSTVPRGEPAPTPLSPSPLAPSPHLMLLS